MTYAWRLAWILAPAAGNHFGTRLATTSLPPYITGMSKRSSQSKDLLRWRISRLKKTPAVDLGTVAAKDTDEAAQIAIKTLAIHNPEHQKRLVASRVG
jgi:phosphoribosylcarboxyaminoimidazole (NCAIR) mutase